MSQTAPQSAAPLPGLSRARLLSRIMAWIFTAAFLVLLTTLVAAPVFIAFPSLDGGIGLPHGIRISFADLSGWPAIGTLAAVSLLVVPILFTLYHACKLFGYFAVGEVFTARPITQMRAAGMWLTACFFTNIAGVLLLQFCGHKILIGPHTEYFGVLFTGIATTIAAYVMDEARRLADENASIV